MRWQFVLGLQPLFLLDDLVLQPRIFISKPMLLAIYSDQQRPSTIHSIRELTKPLNLRPQRNERSFKHLAISQ